MTKFLTFFIIYLEISCSQEFRRHHDLSRPHVPGTIVVVTEGCHASCLNRLGTAGSYQFAVKETLYYSPLGRSIYTLAATEDENQEFLLWLEAHDGISLASLEFLSPSPPSSSLSYRRDEPNFYHLDTIFDGEPPAVIPSNQLVIAITDDGFDRSHPDLQDTFYKNPGETGLDDAGNPKASNGIDDDGNGFVDDYSGWDFAGRGDNDPSPQGNAYHGTHIAGIVGARSHSSKGAQGVAPGIKVLPIRFTGDGHWTPLRFVKAYAYALEMGARIISTSYSIEGFLDDPLVLTILEEAYQRGALVFNSAGNQGLRNPSRQKMNQVVFVGNTYAKPGRRDLINPSSNFGAGIDVFAPGDIYSTLPADRYGSRTGTSMATPVAAAVAALIWNQHPHWNRDQVIYQLLGTAENIQPQNPDKASYTGAGRINGTAALTETPRATSLSLVSQRVSQETGKLLVKVEGILDPKSVNPANFQIVDAQGDRVPIELTGTYAYGSNWIEVNITQPRLGDHQLRLGDSLIDPFGRQPSSPETLQFTVVPHNARLPTIEALSFTDYVIPFDRSFDLNVNLRHAAALHRAQVLLQPVGGGDSVVVQGVIHRQDDGTYQAQLRPQLDGGLPVGQFEITRLVLEDDFGQFFSLEVTLLELPQLVVLGEGDFQLFPSPLRAIHLPDKWQIGQDLPITLEFKEPTDLQEISLLLRAKYSAASPLTAEAFPQGPTDTFTLLLDTAAVQERDIFYVNQVYLKDTSGRKYQLFGRPDKKFFIDSTLPNPNTYLLEELNTDTTPPQLSHASIVAQDPDSRLVSVLVEAQDLESSIKDIRLRIKSDDGELESRSFTSIGSQQFLVDVEMPTWSRDGYYGISYISVSDSFGNRREISDSTQLLRLNPPSPTVFLLGGDREDYHGPQIHWLKMTPSPGALTVTVELTDPAGIALVDIALVSEEDGKILLGTTNSQPQQGPVVITIANPYREETKFRLHTLLVLDTRDNETLMSHDNFSTKESTDGTILLPAMETKSQGHSFRPP